ncbi:hypothetical protein BJ165DRAFT_1599162 [Panaeolus papilionaceus]|nr:hypothetical protein BJ165DRAFT_1599162 [Panaeolus papilionaceus]
MQNHKFNILKISGEIAIHPVDALDNIAYTVIDPTGSGKSSFIEALATKSQNLGISKDQLSGYTQQVNAYQLINACIGIHHDRPIFLIDTPGFSDSQISEIEILDMVRNWLRVSHDLHGVQRVLLMVPITDTRLAGTRRRTIEMLKELLPSGSSITFVTTMWDTVHSERVLRRAKSNFEQLRNEIFKDLLETGATITQFTNTTSSALEILDCYEVSSAAFDNDHSSQLSHLYQDLQERIENTLEIKKSIELDLAQPETQRNLELKSILEKTHEENEETSTKFVAHLAPGADAEDLSSKLRVQLGTVMDTVRNFNLFQAILVSGTVLVEPVERVASGNSTKILVMGLTGVGKSSFIEAVAGTSLLQISNNQLKGFTKVVSTYRVDGVTDGQNRPIYLVDSPGFGDAQVSKMGVIVMLQEWARRNQEAHFDGVLYFTPINAPRLPEYHRQALRLFQTLIGFKRASTVTVVTTMWDALWLEASRRRGEKNFEQNQNDFWRDYIEEGAQIAKFFNTRDSALSILDQALSGTRENYFSVPQDIRQVLDLYCDLQARIQNLHFQRAELQLELSHAVLWGGNLLEASFLSPRFRELERVLVKFQKELQDFGITHLLGPIGSGKSTFIELLSPDMELSIAKDTLQSATQDVTCYRVEGLRDRGGGTFVLMDTPGFVDPHLSESRITTMITKMLDRLRKSAAGVFVSIFYFHPITDIRVGGKKRQAVVLLRAFADEFGALSINVVTTMWNMCPTSQETDVANKRFEKLQEEIFQKSEKLSIQVTKMAFTTNSALSVIDILFSGWIHRKKQAKNSPTPYHSLVRDNLWERIETVYQEWAFLQEDRQYASTPGKEDTRLLEDRSNELFFPSSPRNPNGYIRIVAPSFDPGT